MKRAPWLVALLGLAALAIAPGCSSSPNGEGPSNGPTTTEDPAKPAPASCTPRALTPPTADFFTDISDASGIRMGNFVANPAAPIPINDHSRLAFADLDGDGRDDIVAHSLFPNPQKGIPF